MTKSFAPTWTIPEFFIIAEQSSKQIFMNYYFLYISQVIKLEFSLWNSGDINDCKHAMNYAVQMVENEKCCC